MREAPTLDCKRLCQESCGPVPMTCQEVTDLQDASGLTFTPEPLGPWMLIVDDNGTCQALKNGLCAGYDKRPTVCRLFGMVKKMRCPHGCEPDRWLTDTEARDMMFPLGVGKVETVQ